MTNGSASHPLAAPRLKWLDTLIAAEADRSLGTFQAMAARRSVGVDDLPESMRSRLQGEDGDWMVIVRAAGDTWDPDFLHSFVEDLERIHPRMAGLVPTWNQLLVKLMASLPPMMGLCFAVVALLVLLDLRRFKATVLALTPLVLGVVWTLGVQGLIGKPFNIVSVMAIPLIVGIGIDDGVHIYHRIRHERALGPALMHSGKAVILTSMTTGIGFGSLLLSVHRGFSALGFVALTGVVCCLLISIFLLPALVAIFDEELITPLPACAEPEEPAATAAEEPAS